jgi:hypothetical protein
MVALVSACACFVLQRLDIGICRGALLSVMVGRSALAGLQAAEYVLGHACVRLSGKRAFAYLHGIINVTVVCILSEANAPITNSTQLRQRRRRW